MGGLVSEGGKEAERLGDWPSLTPWPSVPLRRVRNTLWLVREGVSEWVDGWVSQCGWE